MEHIYKYRHLYGLDQAADVLHFKPKDLTLFASETAYYVQSDTQKGDYPRFTVLWTCRRLHEFGSFAIHSSWQTLKDVIDDIKSGGLAIPTIISKIIHFNPINFIKKQFIDVYADWIKSHWKFSSNILKLTFDRMTRTHVILIAILSSASVYLFIRTKVYVKHDPTDDSCVRNKVVLITGGNSGIGERLAHEFVERGAYVIIVASDLALTLEVAHNIMQYMATIRGVDSFDFKHPRTWDSYNPNPLDTLNPMPHNQPRVPEYCERVQWIKIDFGDIRTIFQGAYYIFDVFDHIDIIINAAAVKVPENTKCLTVDEFEIHFGVNFLGHFILTNLLLGYMHEEKPCRIINVTCNQAFQEGILRMEDLARIAATEGQMLQNPYATSKLCMYLFHLELTKRLKLKNKDHIRTYAVCPPECDTNLYRYHEKSWFDRIVPGLPADAGMQTILYCALSPECEKQTGLYYEDCTERTPPFPCGVRDKDSDKICQLLWDIVEINTKRLMQQARDLEGPIIEADLYGNAKLEFLSNLDQQYKPEPVRELIKFRTGFIPIYSRIPHKEWKKEFEQKSLVDWWITCNGPLRFRPSDYTEEEDIINPTRDPIFDPDPIKRKTNGWMYDFEL